MGEDGQFTLWALQEESEKKPHTLLGGMQPSISANREMHHLAPFISFEAI